MASCGCIALCFPSVVSVLPRQVFQPDSFRNLQAVIMYRLHVSSFMSFFFYKKWICQMIINRKFLTCGPVTIMNTRLWESIFLRLSCPNWQPSSGKIISRLTIKISFCCSQRHLCFSENKWGINTSLFLWKLSQLKKCNDLESLLKECQPGGCFSIIWQPWHCPC